MEGIYAEHPLHITTLIKTAFVLGLELLIIHLAAMWTPDI
jgi:hypothetical protein